MIGKTSIWGMLFLVLFLFSTGCNTLEGAGEDVSEVGEDIQDVAE